jgi:hypothetical protein
MDLKNKGALFTSKDTHRLIFKLWNKVSCVSGVQKKTGIAKFTSDKIRLYIKGKKKRKEGHYTFIEVSTEQNNISKYICTQYYDR